MLFVTLSKATLARFVVSLILLLTQKADAHSYADCIDWRFKDPKNRSWSDKNGACFGYARRFPLEAKPFAKLDSDGPNRHYQQSHKNPDPNHSLACSDGKQGEEPGADETMGHPISTAYSGKDKRGRKIVNPKKDPTQLQYLDNIVAILNYKNCTDKGKDTDIWPYGGCFKLPTNLKPGNVVMQWHWELNSNEWYTSCANIKVEARSITTPTVDVPSSTTSASHTPTSASHVPTSVPHVPTSASHTPTSASHTPTSASHAPTSVFQTSTSASVSSASPTTTFVSPTITSAPPITSSAVATI
ncbi:hypothetical protein BG015_005112, partial [Linnemannia schmuckeri]